MSNLSTKEIVEKYNFRFSKNLGQNFLIDNSVLQDILEGTDINKNDFVIEIGPGVGTLTKELLKRAKKVCAIEVDSDLIAILKEELKHYPNFELIHKDVLKTNFNEIIKDESSIKIVANLPYYITTPIISKILNNKYNFKTLTIMIQKEVGERIISEPNCKRYGALSLLVQYYCDVEVLRKVSPYAFIPSPKVESIVIKLTKLSNPRVKIKSEDLFFRIIRCSFNMRRKTLWNALKALKLSREYIEKAFDKSGIDPKRRGETLSIEEFGLLSDCIYELIYGL
ncbi:16S rRNA (adenine(1518)-N(6)/adenine(1519)-N(6))-dimethyltransferase RsmA [Clostridium kluyveri]|uniref:Ribosomal RNA small subunit methyltransferase A n=1 Tax=Clostridium kluyveri TaxID=1534 RepID=A0A1L5FDN1_CLOKL|nr:16S rRNA (adenine(1518)-N(6)/adenine(1519)-N(6))-dimethyltransferase RsmA [Clostridium kluyveri]APM41063.1 16S rRNA (adenine(1518)-N(6)/adenine(1519)-N(6))-dimethyltransferase [Clostridium kluyveri]UZQ48658.1 16S rRNA (adenine(1518)-N(6)/adenine(1519)-N(6))-dimethyltransferase RsmA [Clostridium kluyveri]